MTPQPVAQRAFQFSAVSLSTLLATAIAAASAQDSGRVKRKRPTIHEAERMISETVMNDGSLRKGDIVATNRGFFVFEGIAADGVTFEFRPVPNPIRR
jgi:hypothetical protein